MAGITDLDTLLASVTAKLHPGTYVFATLPDGRVPTGVTPRMIFEEEEGTTLILLQSEATAHGIAHEFPCRMITLNIHSALEAVGFIARIASALAEQNMGVNPVAGFFHDHLFIPEDRAQDALDVIANVARSASQGLTH